MFTFTPFSYVKLTASKNFLLKFTSKRNNKIGIKHKIGQSLGFFGRLLGPLLKTGLSLMGNILKPLAERVLIPLGLTAVA